MSVKLFVERSKKSIDTIRLGWDRAACLDGIFGKRRFPIFEVWDADYDVSKNGFTRAARNLSAIYPRGENPTSIPIILSIFLSIKEVFSFAAIIPRVRG